MKKLLHGLKIWRRERCDAVPQIKWLPEALADVEQPHMRSLHEKSPDAAARAATAILDGADFLQSIPEIGVTVSGFSKRFSTLFFPLRELTPKPGCHFRNVCAKYPLST